VFGGIFIMQVQLISNRRRIQRKRLLAATVFGSMAIALTPAMAQDATSTGPTGGALSPSTAVPPKATQSPVAQSGTLENITVTARRREEKLQNVPQQITAITGKELSAAGATDLRDITFLTPAITLFS